MVSDTDIAPVPSSVPSSDASPSTLADLSGDANVVQDHGTVEFVHLTRNVLGLKETDPVALSLRENGIADSGDLLGLSSDDIAGMTYPHGDKDGKISQVTLNLGQRGKLKSLKDYVAWEQWNGNTSLLDYTAIEYHCFRTDPSLVAPTRTSRQPDAVVTQPRAPSGAISKDPLVELKKSVKLDLSAYGLFKTDLYFDNWHREFVATARAHGMNDVLDPDYVPRNPTDEKVFDFRNGWMYTVFVKTLQTENGRQIVRKYEAEADAQSVYRDLVAYYRKSTFARTTARDILKYLVRTSIDSHWNGTTQAFVLHFLEQVRQYRKLKDDDGALGDAVVFELLQQSVSTVPDLRQVEVTAEVAAQKDGTDLSLDQYKASLISAAVVYDDSVPVKKPSRRRLVNSSTVVDPSDDSDDEDPFTIDTPISTVKAFATKQSRPSSTDSSRDAAVHIPSDFWRQLSREDQRAWSSISSAGKAVLLSAGSSATRSARLHEVSGQVPVQSYLHHSLPMGSVPSSMAPQLAPPYPPVPSYTHAYLTQQAPPTAMVPYSAPPTTESTASTPIMSNVTQQSSGSSTPPASGSPSHPGQLGQMLGDPRQQNPHHKRHANFHQSSNLFSANVHRTVVVSKSKTIETMSLIDRGANAGVAGSDVRLLHTTHRKVNIEGIDNHQITDVPIGTVAGLAQTQFGYAILIFHQYAYTGRGNTIHSPGQLESYKNDVNDKSIRVPGGKQRIKTPDGYVLPLDVSAGLVRLKLAIPSDEDMDRYPHVIMTSESEWDPAILDYALTGDENWFDALDEPLAVDMHINRFDEVGDYRHRVVVRAETTESSSMTIDDEGAYFIDSLQDIYGEHLYGFANADPYLAPPVDPDLDPNMPHLMGSDSDAPDDESIDGMIDGAVYRAYASLNRPVDPSPTVDNTANEPHVARCRKSKTKLPDFEKLRPLFGWLSTDIIAKTWAATTQYARIPNSTILKKHFKSQNPALNVARRNEPVATDTIFADDPAIDHGATCAQVFVGTDSLVTDLYPLKSERQFVNAFEDNIRERGAPDKLIRDSAKVEDSDRVRDLLRTLFISDWKSEPYQQHQNFAERRIQTLKTTVNTIMDRVSAPGYTWLLCMCYVCFLLNNVFNNTIETVPLQKLKGSTNDISPLLRFYFYEPVYYKVDDSDFPSESRERRGYFVGIAENVGHQMTFKILTDDTNKVICRSNVRSAASTADRNRRLDILGGEISTDSLATPTLKSSADFPSSAKPDYFKATLSKPADLLGRSFLSDEDNLGQRHRTHIVRALDKLTDDLNKEPARIQFIVNRNGSDVEEIMSYNEIVEHLSRDAESDVLWRYKSIVGHQGPLKADDPDYQGSSYNVMVDWESGERTYIPLDALAKDDPVTCAKYAEKHGLLNTPGWRRFRRITKNQKKFTRMAKQAMIYSYKASVKYKFGFEVPKDYARAIELDRQAGNTLWADAVSLEKTQLFDYETFHDHGKVGRVPPPKGHQKIRVHLVFDVKHDGRHKARLVADGHLTAVPLDSVYSGVVSLRGIRILLFLAELNSLPVWATDIGNAYLEAKTKEKLYIVAGPEFGELEGHYLIIHKALYGLRSSGARWHDRFSACLKELGFSPSKSEPDIWMRENGDTYEYIAVYVDDLAIALREPQKFIDALTNTYKFKLKGTGEIEYHLGMDFFRDAEGYLCIAPKKYIEKLSGTYERIFGTPPSPKYNSPLPPGDHPELDESELLDALGTTHYQSLIGAMQWAVSIGRLDINTAVMTMSSFRALPRRGHLERVKRIAGFLVKFKHAAIRVDTREPDYSTLPVYAQDWSNSVYGDPKEAIPHDAPKPLGRRVILTHYVDANLMHDMTTGRSVTGILHFMNRTPVDWFSKKQNTVETATFGSEFVAARTCVEQIIDLRLTLRYLGVPIAEASIMFGDNKTVVDSSTIPHGKLHKRHTALSFHRVREAIASKMVEFHHLPGSVNPADILSKHWAYSDIWENSLKPLLFWDYKKPSKDGSLEKKFGS